MSRKPKITVRTLSLALFLAALAIAMTGPAFGQDEPASAEQEPTASQEESGDAEPAPEYSRQGADNCLRCHNDKGEYPVLDIFKTAHGSRGNPDGPFGDGNLQCEACHGPSGGHRRREDRLPEIVFGVGKKTPPEEQNAVCLGCHTDHGRLGWFGSVHEEEEMICSTCHNVHAEHDPMANSLTQQEVCFDCHQRTRSASLMPSSHPLRFGEMACSDCHDAHNGLNEAQLVETTVNDTCYTCHAEKRGPVLWEHAPVAEDCSLCHAPHGNNHSGMLTQRPPLLCQQCHMPSGHPSLPYSSDSIESEYASRFLLGSSCGNCHTQVHGSNHPSGYLLTR